jgi:transketolase
LDYVGAFREFFGWKAIVPADPNQTDRAVRAMAAMQGNVALSMGRSKLPCVLDSDGAPIFGDGYAFEYGRIDVVRDGADAFILAMGTPVGSAVAAADVLSADGVSVGVAVVSCPLDLDDAAMQKVAGASVIVTVEDHNVRTGLGASVAEWLSGKGSSARLVRMGLDDYQPSGAAGDLYEQAGLDPDGIGAKVRAEIAG